MSDSTEIPFSRPDIGEAEIDAVTRVLKSGWLTTGSEARQFEQEFCAYTSARYAVAVSSATAGLHLMLEAMGVGKNDYVALSPYTFASSAEVIRYLGAHPLFVDIEADGYNICPQALEEALLHAQQSGKTVRAVMPVHIAGRACDMERIREIAANHDLQVLEDAAHALPSTDSTGVRIGARGNAVFSFYANKPVTSAEGGMITTDNEVLYERVMRMRLHGIDRTIWDRYRRPGAGWSYDVIEAGYKYNLPDVLASLGRVQLSRSDETHAMRSALAVRYADLLHRVDGVTVLNNPAKDQARAGADAWHLFMIAVNPEHRDSIIEYMAKERITCSVHYRPLHMMSYYRRQYGTADNDAPRAHERFLGAISLPLFPGLSEREQDRVVSVLGRALRACCMAGEHG
ncbi:MAG: DegT/DnrJ/EryC1/StrS family aminotransferase [Spirochaetaceae bacterium]